MAAIPQLDRFAEALFRHPFKTGVFKPSNVNIAEAIYRHRFKPGTYDRSNIADAMTPVIFLKEFALHFEECTYSLCMGYHNAFLIAYFSHLSQEELSELLASLREDDFNYGFLKRAYFFIEREARSDCAPIQTFVSELRDSNQVWHNPATGREEVSVRGRVLAKDMRASMVHVRHLTLSGENFLIPGIAPGLGSDYLPVNLVAECLRRVVEDWPQGIPDLPPVNRFE